MAEEQTPEWAKKIEDWGKQFQKEQDENKKEKKPRWERKGEIVGDIIGSLIAYFIFNNVQRWFPGFFTEGFTAVLWVFNISIYIHILGSIILLLFSPKFFFYLVRTVFNIIGVITIIVMVSLFPFNVPYGLSYLVRLAMILSGVILAIVTIFEFFQIIIPERQS